MPTLYESRREQMFPKLSPAQLSRLGAYGQRVPTREAEILVDSGERYGRIVAVLSGSIDVLLPGLTGETTITQLTAGDFTGEMSALRGSSSYVRVRVHEAGEVISISAENLRRLIQADAELSELFMRAFILRRMPCAFASSWNVMLCRIPASTLSMISMRWHSLSSFRSAFTRFP
jgi:thioredoxin reductase (NADPH)